MWNWNRSQIPRGKPRCFSISSITSALKIIPCTGSQNLNASKGTSHYPLLPSSVRSLGNQNLKFCSQRSMGKVPSSEVLAQFPLLFPHKPKASERAELGSLLGSTLATPAGTTHISCTTMYWWGTSPSIPLCLPSHQSSEARWYSSRDAPFLKDSSLADRPT